MDPLRPSPRLLRKLAALLGACDDAQVRAWVDAVRAAPKPERIGDFAHVSVVKTYRNGKFCGYEVWRHLESSRVDPRRQKARLWFGKRRHSPARALDLAKKAASMLEGMSRTELHEWWAEQRAARDERRNVDNLWRDEQRFEDGLDYSDLQQISHVHGCVG